MRFKNPMHISDLRDYSDAFIAIRKRITVYVTIVT